MTAVVTGHGHALPAAMDQDTLWEGYFREHYADARVARTVWSHSGIRTRHGVMNPLVEDVSTWGTAARMQRFVQEAVPLGGDAVGKALADAGLAAQDVGCLVVASCTGYATPGVDILVARDLGMDPGAQRLHVGHMGCYAAMPALGAASDFVVARGRPAVLLCVELTSLHVQPTTESARRGEPTKADLQQMVAHALFADAAAALVLEPGGSGWEVLDSVARTDVSTADHMTWDVTDLGFVMGLSPRVPDVLAEHVGPVVAELLDRHGLATTDVAGWAVHPGGRRIVEVVAEALGLTEEQTAPSYGVLEDCGNCSSATVLLVLERVKVDPGEYAVAMAFGPGLTLCATLLRQR
jgi:alkylresorcinol/alkylpyrone synthase